MENQKMTHWLGEDTTNIFIFDQNNQLRRKIWIYSDGSVHYREWDEKGKEITSGEKPILGRVD